MKLRMKKITTYFLIAGLMSTISVYAQRDTIKPHTIDVISSYKPVLRNAVKINLTPAVPETDTSKPKLTYNIPAMNLFFAYRPAELMPHQLTPDTASHLGERNFVKAGFGSLTTPYLNAGFSFGNAKKGLLNLYGDYISSKDKIANQDFSIFNIKAAGSYFLPSQEVYGSLGYRGRIFYQYGYDTLLFHYPSDSIRRDYRDIAIRAGVRNTKANAMRISYDPNIEAHIFSRGSDVKENNIILTLPAEKRIGESVVAKVSLLADLTNYTKSPAGGTDFKIKNNLVQIAPELVYYSEKFTFHGGIIPSWNNGAASMLPNIYGEAQLQHNIVLLQAGWTGRFIKNNFRTLSEYNPYIQDPLFLANTKEMQYYGGLKATVGKHFTFNTKIAFITYNNMPLFMNDTAASKGFIVVNESKLNDFQIHADMNYISQDKFTVSAAMDVNTYSSLEINKNAWGLIPFQITGSFRWNAFKQVLIKGDVFYFTDVPVITKGNGEAKLPAAIDLGAGAEFRLNKNFSAWLDFANILNKKYQRWNNYPVYGMQVIGGFIYHF